MSRTLLFFGTLGLLAITGLGVAAVGRPGPAPEGVVAVPATSSPSAEATGPAEPAEPARTPSPALASPPMPEPAGSVAPFVQTFAGQPGVRPLPKLPSPTTTHRVAAFVDGCDHAYGDPTQCVPLTFPEGTKDKCAWLTAHGLTKIIVVGEDRQKLDPDGDKVACSSR